MNRKMCFALVLALIMLLCAGCGGKEDPVQTTQAASAAPVSGSAPGLSSFTLETTTWSSPNGATVTLTAVPDAHDDNDRAAFVVRLEGEEVASVLCDWDGTQYTGSLDLNAADGYCYYVVLSNGDGSQTEVAVNTPTDPLDDALINMAASLQSYCNILVDDSSYDGSVLTLKSGTVQVQVPQITNAGEAITCQTVQLLLKFNEETVAQQEVTLTESEFDGLFEQSLEGVRFDVPDMENDQQLKLEAQATLSNGHVLSAPAGTWYYNEGELLQAVG